MDTKQLKQYIRNENFRITTQLLYSLGLIILKLDVTHRCVNHLYFNELLIISLDHPFNDFCFFTSTFSFTLCCSYQRHLTDYSILFLN